MKMKNTKSVLINNNNKKQYNIFQMILIEIN